MRSGAMNTEAMSFRTHSNDSTRRVPGNGVAIPQDFLKIKSSPPLPRPLDQAQSAASGRSEKANF